MQAALEMRGVVKRYGKRKALDGLNLRIPQGALVGIVGSNGAGKTTTLSIAAGITRANAGTIDVLGQGPFDPATAAGRVSLIPQGATFPAYAQVRDLLLFYGRLQGMAEKDARRGVDENLERVHLADRASSTIRSLSHGMRRRVALAQAFLGDPDLVLLDEPMSGLDPREVVNARRMLSHRKPHQAIIVSSHNLAELERVCDDVAFIERGRSMRQASVAAVTGRGHIVSYYLDRAPATTAPLAECLPGVQLSLRTRDMPADTGRNGCGAVLRCEYHDNAITPAVVNAALLPRLLGSGIGVLEVRCGSELEEAYLELSGRQPGSND
jgi:ABC-2 type transport system ATP-binding protein